MKAIRIRTVLFSLCLLSLFLGCGPDATTDPGKKSDKGGSSGKGSPSDGVEVIVEAETMTASGLFEALDDADASAGKAMRVPVKEECPDPRTETPDGSLAFDLNLKTDTTVTIWCRVKWDDTCSNSFTLILPSGMKKIVSGSTLKKWFWIAAAKDVDLKAGSHKLSIAAREYGAHIDQILVTDDAARVPRGVATNFKEMAKE